MLILYSNISYQYSIIRPHWLLFAFNLTNLITLNTLNNVIFVKSEESDIFYFVQRKPQIIA